MRKRETTNRRRKEATRRRPKKRADSRPIAKQIAAIQRLAAAGLRQGGSVVLVSERTEPGRRRVKHRHPS